MAIRPIRTDRCRPTLWHLFILLSISMCLISFILYSLNSYFESRYGGTGTGFLASDTGHDFKADFRTLPHTLPGGRRRLIVLINSRWNNFDRRSTIRNTWALNQHRLNCSIFFVVGDSDQSGIVGVTEEGAFFHDIIQPTVWEDDQNIILKFLAAFRFVESELEADFVMKTNDDAFVNVPELINFLQSETHAIDNSQLHLSDSDRPRKLTVGHVIKGSTPDISKKPDLSANFWPKHIPFPDYVSGTGYVVSFDVMSRFNVCPKFIDLLPLEDVYFTGLCRQHFGLSLSHNDKFTQSRLLNIPCIWKTKFLTTGVKQNDMETIWNTINKKSTPQC